MKKHKAQSTKQKAKSKKHNLSLGNISITLLGCLFLVYCSDSYNSPAEIAKVDEQWEQQMIAATEYVGSVFSQKGVISDFQSKLIVRRGQSRNETDEELSFRELLNPESEINKARVQSKVKGGLSFYKAWRGKNNQASIQEFESLAALEAFLLENDLSMYFPYSEVFDSVAFSTITISYFDMVNEDENEGLVVSSSSGTTTQFSNSWSVSVTDDYAYSNPTIIIKPIEPIEENVEEPLFPPPTSTLLTENMNHRNISQEDVLVTTIPKMRLTDHYRGVFGGASKISIYRASGTYTYAEDGDIIAGAETKAIITDFKFSRNSIREGKWLEANILFDNDWDATEYERDMVVVSKHWANFSGGFKVEGGVQISLDKLSDGNFTPSFDTIAGTGNWELTFNTWYKLRHNLDYSRKSVLANITNDLGNGVKKHNGINYTIWKADKLLFHFEHQHIKM